MPNGDEDPQDQRDDADEDASGGDRETEPESAKTRAGSNIPNAAGNRDDGTHE